jgi:hypothetical protein
MSNMMASRRFESVQEQHQGKGKWIMAGGSASTEDAAAKFRLKYDQLRGDICHHDVHVLTPSDSQAPDREQPYDGDMYESVRSQIFKSVWPST